MIPKPTIVTGLLLAVAVLTFVGISYQTVPMSTTNTEALTSYSPYSVHTTTTYLSTSSATSTYTLPATTSCGGGFYPAICNSYPPSTVRVIYVITGLIVHLGYWTQETAAVPYTVTESSTSLVPASAALGLTNAVFTTLAVVVIGILALLMAYVTLKPRVTHRASKP